MVHMQSMTIRFPRPLHDQLRERSFRTRVPMNVLVRQATHLMLNKTSPEMLEQWLAANPVPEDDDPQEPEAPADALDAPRTVEDPDL